jgi:hypothetical protein
MPPLADDHDEERPQSLEEVLASGDLTLRLRDGSELRVHKHMLAMVSPVIRQSGMHCAARGTASSRQQQAQAAEAPSSACEREKRGREVQRRMRAGQAMQRRQRPCCTRQGTDCPRCR